MKMVLVLFYYQKIIILNYCFLQLCYLVATSTAGKSQLFQRWREWEYIGLKFAVAKAKVFPHLVARIRVGRGIPHSKDSTF
jgi:hypothetical protein